MEEEEKPKENTAAGTSPFEPGFNIIPFLEKISSGLLGQGSSGIVEKTLYRPSNLIVALKSILLNSDETFIKQLKSELDTLLNCNSPYIVRCWGADYQQGAINIALEYMDIGSLTDVLKAVGKIPEVILGMIVLQVLKGLEYLHKTLKVIHRDIKPSNLLVNSQGQVKIADFGVSGKIIHTNDQKTSWVGTIAYMSPERYNGEQYTSNTDIWSLGLTILECALGRYPYPPEGNTNMGFLDLMDYININPIPKLPENFSDKIVDFVSICLSKEPAKRSSANELLEHRFVKQFENIGNQPFIEWLKIVNMNKF